MFIWPHKFILNRSSVCLKVCLRLKNLTQVRFSRRSQFCRWSSMVPKWQQLPWPRPRRARSWSRGIWSWRRRSRISLHTYRTITIQFSGQRFRFSDLSWSCPLRTYPSRTTIFRDRLKSMQILLSRTQPEPGRKGKQEQSITNFSQPCTKTLADLCT